MFLSKKKKKKNHHGATINSNKQSLAVRNSPNVPKINNDVERRSSLSYESCSNFFQESNSTTLATSLIYQCEEGKV